MSRTLTDLQKQLDGALQLIKNDDLLSDKAILPGQLNENNNNIEFSQTISLLAKCEQVCAQLQVEKPTLRIIHHLAFSGGSLVSKCISAMPNVFVLNEVHPHSDFINNIAKAQYSPSDLAKLAISAGVPEQKELAEKIFIGSVKTSHQHIIERGGTLILRNHSHSDYCVGQQVCNNTVVELLKEHFQILSLVTLRNPIDCYLSLVANGWVDFQPATFDEYCARLLSSLKPFRKEQIVFYEDFVQQPQQVVEQMCSILQIPFDNTFEAMFDVFSVTDNNGRGGDVIEHRKRRDVSEVIKEEVNQSSNFKIICDSVMGINLL